MDRWLNRLLSLAAVAFLLSAAALCLAVAKTSLDHAKVEAAEAQRAVELRAVVEAAQRTQAVGRAATRASRRGRDG
jgi:hypothetical protein